MIHIKLNTNSNQLVKVEESGLKYQEGSVQVFSVKENTIHRKDYSDGERSVTVIKDGYVLTEFKPVERYIERRGATSLWHSVREFNKRTYNVDNKIYISDSRMYRYSKARDTTVTRSRMEQISYTKTGHIITKEVVLPNVYDDRRICIGGTGGQLYNQADVEDSLHAILNGFFSTEFNSDLSRKHMDSGVYDSLRSELLTRRAEELDVGRDDIVREVRKIEEDTGDDDIIRALLLAALLNVDYGLIADGRVRN